MDSRPALSDYFARLPSSPDLFPFFYRGLVGLRFPIEVAEILELRYLCHQVVDRAENDGQGYEWSEFASERNLDMDRLGIQKSPHRERLSQFLILMHGYHTDHKKASAASETALYEALRNNRFAQDRSHHYGKTAGFAAIISAASAFLLSPYTAVIEGLAVLLAYFSLDSFYSLLVLKREERRLEGELREVTRRRVRSVNWKAVVRQTAAILGYTQPRCGEAFRSLPEQEFHEFAEVDQL